MASNQSDLEKIVVDLRKEIRRLSNSVTKFEEDLAKLKNNGNPYWEGPSAYEVVKNSMSQIKRNQSLIESLNQCLVYAESLLK